MRANTSYSRTRDTVLRRRRRTTMTTKGGKQLTGLNKRPHPGWCELCNQIKGPKGHPIRLEYHHWDDSNPNKGMWLCRACHVFAGMMDAPAFGHTIGHYMAWKDFLNEQYDKPKP